MDKISSKKDAENYLVAALIESGLSREESAKMLVGAYSCLAATSRLDNSQDTLLALSWIRPPAEGATKSTFTTHWHCPNCGKSYGLHKGHNCEG